MISLWEGEYRRAAMRPGDADRGLSELDFGLARWVFRLSIPSAPSVNFWSARELPTTGSQDLVCCRPAEEDVLMQGPESVLGFARTVPGFTRMECLPHRADGGQRQASWLGSSYFAFM